MARNPVATGPSNRASPFQKGSKLESRAKFQAFSPIRGERNRSILLVCHVARSCIDWEA
jgi:hypothetical protein